MNSSVQSKLTGTALLFGVVLVALFAHRLWLLLQPWVGLYHDEIYYYHWSLIPDFGYYSKPPMIAWIIGLSSSLAGPSSLGIKLGPAVCWMLTALIVAQIGTELWGRDRGWLTSLAFFSTPLAGFYSLFATTDSALLLFWTLSLWGFLRTQKVTAAGQDPMPWWLLAGIATGMGLLSKYTMLALPFSYLLFMLTSAERRQQFSTVGPWLAGSVALALFALNVLWNVEHNFVALRHTSEIAQLDEGPLLNLGSLAQFWLSQIGIFGILGSLLLLWHWRVGKASLIKCPSLQVIVLSSAVLLAGISLQALLSRAFANWAAPVVIGLTFLLGALAEHRPRAVLLAIAFNVAMLFAFYHWPAILEATGLPTSKRSNPWLRVDPWAERLVQAGGLSTADLALPVASDSRAILSELHHALRPREFPSRYWDNRADYIADYYDQTINFSDWPGQGSWLFATDHPLAPDQLRSFRAVVPLLEVPAYYAWRPNKTLFVYRVKDFIGYD